MGEHNNSNDGEETQNAVVPVPTLTNMVKEPGVLVTADNPVPAHPIITTNAAGVADLLTVQQQQDAFNSNALSMGQEYGHSIAGATNMAKEQEQRDAGTGLNVEDVTAAAVPADSNAHAADGYADNPAAVNDGNPGISKHEQEHGQRIQPNPNAPLMNDHNPSNSNSSNNNNALWGLANAARKPPHLQQQQQMSMVHPSNALQPTYQQQPQKQYPYGYPNNQGILPGMNPPQRHLDLHQQQQQQPMGYPSPMEKNSTNGNPGNNNSGMVPISKHVPSHNHAPQQTGRQTFPVKLHAILTDNSCDSVCGWAIHGRAWRVHDTKAFATNILPRYFKHASYKSFTRQVNFWGFNRITSGPDQNYYYHEYFLRGNVDLCRQMIRKKQNNSAVKTKHLGDGPDFYSMPTSGDSGSRGFMKQEQLKMGGISGIIPNAAQPPGNDVHLLQQMSSGAPHSLQYGHGIGAPTGLMGMNGFHGNQVGIQGQNHHMQASVHGRSGMSGLTDPSMSSQVPYLGQQQNSLSNIGAMPGVGGGGQGSHVQYGVGPSSNSMHELILRQALYGGGSIHHGGTNMNQQTNSQLLQLQQQNSQGCANPMGYMSNQGYGDIVGNVGGRNSFGMNHQLAIQNIQAGNSLLPTQQQQSMTQGAMNQIGNSVPSYGGSDAHDVAINKHDEMSKMENKNPASSEEREASFGYI